MTAVSIEEPLPEGGGFFGGTSKHKKIISQCFIEF